MHCNQLLKSTNWKLSHVPTDIYYPQDIKEADKPHYVLKTLFGCDTFRSGQLEAIQTILGGRDCLI